MPDRHIVAPFNEQYAQGRTNGVSENRGPGNGGVAGGSGFDGTERDAVDKVLLHDGIHGKDRDNRKAGTGHLHAVVHGAVSILHRGEAQLNGFHGVAIG